MKFALMSDTHYISRRMISDEQDAELMLQPAVSEQALLQAAEKNDTILIIGDLTDSGDRYSHEDFVDFLRSVKAKGKRICVTFASHDFNHHKAYVRKRGKKTNYSRQPWSMPWCDIDKLENGSASEFSSLGKDELVEALSPEEIWEMYKEFGADDAYSVHEESFSYCVELDENTRCLMLNDIFRNEEALEDKSPTYTPSCFKWIKRMYDEAQRDGKYIFVCSHHPFLPAVPAHRIGAGEGNRNLRSPDVGHTLADMGINLVFSGHSHFCNAGFLKSPEGNLLFEVTAPSPRFYPPSYRNIELDGQKGRIKYDCEYVEIPNGYRIDEPTLFEHYHRVFYNQYYEKITGSNELVKKILDRACVKDIYFLVRNKARLTQSEYARVKDKKVFDFVIEIAFNMLIGDGSFTPDTPEYKIMMSLCAKLDSIIDTQPFTDVRKKYLGGYGFCEIIEPMLFNNSVSDREADFDFTHEPERTIQTPVYTSRAGDAVMAVVYALAVLLSGTAPAVAAIGIPLLTIRKKLKNKNIHLRPNYDYHCD